MYVYVYLLNGTSNAINTVNRFQFDSSVTFGQYFLHCNDFLPTNGRYRWCIFRVVLSDEGGMCVYALLYCAFA